MKFARLKPHNGKTHLLRSYTVFGIKFEEAKGWYKVDDDVAEYLSTVKQITDGPDAEFSADAFDIVDSLDDAKRIDQREKQKAVRKAAEEAQPTKRVHAVGKESAAKAARAAVENLERSKADTFDNLSGDFDDDMAGDAPPAPADPIDEAEEEDEASPDLTSSEVQSSPSKPPPRSRGRR